MTIKAFGENSKQKWYELLGGGRIVCDEKTIDTLWWAWVCKTDSKRNDTNEFTVFEFGKPIEMNTLTV